MNLPVFELMSFVLDDSLEVIVGSSCVMPSVG
jgi:hypothetical protein